MNDIENQELHSIIQEYGMENYLISITIDGQSFISTPLETVKGSVSVSCKSRGLGIEYGKSVYKYDVIDYMGINMNERTITANVNDGNLGIYKTLLGLIHMYLNISF